MSSLRPREDDYLTVSQSGGLPSRLSSLVFPLPSLPFGPWFSAMNRTRAPCVLELPPCAQLCRLCRGKHAGQPTAGSCLPGAHMFGGNSQTGAPRPGRCCKQVKFSNRAERERDVLSGGAEANIPNEGKESKGTNTGDIGSVPETVLP